VSQQEAGDVPNGAGLVDVELMCGVRPEPQLRAGDPLCQDESVGGRYEDILLAVDDKGRGSYAVEPMVGVVRRHGGPLV
jgi:hypothetical protein